MAAKLHRPQLGSATNNRRAAQRLAASRGLELLRASHRIDIRPDVIHVSGIGRRDLRRAGEAVRIEWCKHCRRCMLSGGVTGSRTVSHSTAELAAQRRRVAERSTPEYTRRSAVGQRLNGKPARGFIQRLPTTCHRSASIDVKRRAPSQNWYTLPSRTRRLMQAHGITGRPFGKMATGGHGGLARGLGVGVELFARFLDFKKLVTDMRFDEVSAKYAEFGGFLRRQIIR